MLAAISATVYAQTISVTIGTPSSSNGDLGITEGNYWIGQFPITITQGTSTTTGEVYCMTPGGTVYEGTTYNGVSEVAVPTNDPEWQEISYILTWDAPTTGTQAAIDQVAIWMCLGQNPTGSPPQYADFPLDQSIITQASALVAQVSQVDGNGPVNMALQGAQMRWVAPGVGSEGNPGGSVTTSAQPGSQITFQVQVFDSSGNAQENVQVAFSGIVATSAGITTTLNPSYLSSMTAFTDSDGIATVTVTVPPNTPLNSKIQLTASSPTIWPTEYLDLIDSNSGTQNLIGLSPQFDLTANYNVYVLGYVTVLPESALGALSALVACMAGFAIYYKLKPKSKQRV